MPVKKVASTFRVVNRLYRQGFVPRPELNDLTILEAMTLSFVAEESGQTTADIARKVGVRRDTIEKLVAKLSGLKLVHVAPADPSESHGPASSPHLAAVTITTQGEELSALVDAAWDRWEKDDSEQRMILERVSRCARQMIDLLGRDDSGKE